MRTPPSSPWIVRCSVQLYRWLLCLGPYAYRRQYADRTLQLFRECCQDAYRQRGILGVLALWLPLFSDVVTQMLAEYLSELQRTSELHVSVFFMKIVPSQPSQQPHSISRCPTADRHPLQRSKCSYSRPRVHLRRASACQAGYVPSRAGY